MQTSGTAPQFSDGVRKTVVGTTPPAQRAPAPVKPQPVSTHRRGGHAKHKAGK